MRTDLFLTALFERYAQIERVTVASDPRRGSDDDDEDAQLFRTASLGGLEEWKTGREKGDGKFAHVVFPNGKEMKRALRGIKEDAEENEMVQLENEVFVELAQQTDLLRHAEDSHDDDGDKAISKLEKLSGIQSIASQYARSANRHLSRSQLMEQCNALMSKYEQSESEAARRAKRLAEEPDEDGFITVTHNSSTPTFSSSELETTQLQIGRGKGSKRSRKRKAENRHGGGEFSDFYKFQWKEMKKKEMNDLKARFEEDLEKVKRMKEERAFRPF